MAVFEYRGHPRRRPASRCTGVRDADNAEGAPRARSSAKASSSRARTRRRRREAGASGDIDLGAFFRRVSVGDVAMMTRQLATLVDAGIPLVEAVSALIEQVEKLELKRVLTQVRDRLNEGSSLAKALEPHPHDLLRRST